MNHAVILLCVFALPLVAQFPRLPRLPTPAERTIQKAKDISEIQISTEQEVTLGKEVAARMITYMSAFDNQKATAYVRKVGALMAAQAERQDVKYS